MIVAGPGLAGSFTVTPIRVSLPADGSPQVVRLRNLTAEPTLVQVETLSWSDTDEPPDEDTTQEVLAVPPVFELAGDGEQVIRLAMRRPLQGPTEKAFRLYLTEVPRETDAQPGALMMALRLNLPVFVTPEGAAPDPAWSLRRGSNGTPELILDNQGDAHLVLRAVRLSADGSAQPILSEAEPTYVLAGGEKSWPISLPAGTVKELSVRAETSLGELEAQVALPGG